MSSKLFDRIVLKNYRSRVEHKERIDVLHAACLTVEDYLIEQTIFTKPDYHRYTIYIDNPDGKGYIRFAAPNKPDKEYTLNDVNVQMEIVGQPMKEWLTFWDFCTEMVTPIDGEETAKEEF